MITSGGIDEESTAQNMFFNFFPSPSGSGSLTARYLKDHLERCKKSGYDERTRKGLAGRGVQARGCRQGGAGRGVQAGGCRQGGSGRQGRAKECR